ncbi:MAG: hypothetical protein QOE02_5540 [Rhodospirillaceae bacterium]|jgi:hypothetical protein|nr:hypothetical protein [Rhodospirillaceae bacterium]
MVEAAPVLDAPMACDGKARSVSTWEMQSEWSGCNLFHWTAFPEAARGESRSS